MTFKKILFLLSLILLAVSLFSCDTSSDDDDEIYCSVISGSCSAESGRDYMKCNPPTGGEYVKVKGTGIKYPCGSDCDRALRALNDYCADGYFDPQDYPDYVSDLEDGGYYNDFCYDNNASCYNIDDPYDSYNGSYYDPNYNNNNNNFNNNNNNFNNNNNNFNNNNNNFNNNNNNFNNNNNNFNNNNNNFGNNNNNNEGE